MRFAAVMVSKDPNSPQDEQSTTTNFIVSGPGKNVAVAVNFIERVCNGDSVRTVLADLKIACKEELNAGSGEKRDENANSGERRERGGSGGRGGRGGGNSNSRRR